MGTLIKVFAGVITAEFGSTIGRINAGGVALIFGIAYLLLRRSDRILELRLKNLKSMSKRAQAQILSDKVAQVPAIVLGFISAGLFSLCVCAVLLYPGE